jgi:hypothetical protein
MVTARLYGAEITKQPPAIIALNLQITAKLIRQNLPAESKNLRPIQTQNTITLFPNKSVDCFVLYQTFQLCFSFFNSGVSGKLDEIFCLIS